MPAMSCSDALIRAIRLVPRSRRLVADAKTKQLGDTDRLWYKDAIIYQLHVKSFFDSNVCLTRYLIRDKAIRYAASRLGAQTN
jgi:hypothetical protein